MRPIHSYVVKAEHELSLTDVEVGILKRICENTINPEGSKIQPDEVEFGRELHVRLTNCQYLNWTAK